MTAASISIRNKSTSIRLSEKTKRQLESLAKGKETHEQILLRLIRLAILLDDGSGYGGGSAPGFGFADGSGDSTTILRRGNAVGTTYGRTSSMIKMKFDGKPYEILCTYNDLSLMALLRSRKLREAAISDGNGLTGLDWEINLEIANVKTGRSWSDPSSLPAQERKLLQLICTKQVLEETFNAKLHELVTDDDFLSTGAWTQAYRRNGFSGDSLRSDILKVLE